MINLEQIIQDNLSDEIGILVTKLHGAAAGRDREAARKALTEAAISAGYVFFAGNCNRYNLHCLGESLLYRVPDNKRGNLQVFRGKLVRICCWHRGERFERKLLAGVVGEDQIPDGLIGEGNE